MNDKSEAKPEPSRWGSVWRRIKEHKIVEWTIAYVAFAFIALHGATLLSDALEWPHAIVRAVTFLLILGLPIVPILAWYHGVRALKRVSGSELIIITLLLAIGGSLLWLLPRPAAERARVETPGLPATTSPKPETAEPAFNPPAHSVAVLPFVNMSGDPKEDYFSDGVSEELLNALSRLNDLQVVARTSSFSFKGKDVDVATIARKLNVGAVLEGSVRRAGNTVRITAQLINAVTGFHLWSETYDRPFSDILKVQTEVATAVAQQLEIKLAGNETVKFEVGGSRNPDAYDAYLRAERLYEEDFFGSATLRAALTEVDQAIALDPNYAGAHALRAAVLANLTHLSNADKARDLHEQALASAEHAVALAPDFGDAHAVLGAVRAEWFFDFAGAAAEFDRALALAPGSAYVQRNVAIYTALFGHFEPAINAAQRAVSLDPQNWLMYRQQARALFFARRYGESLAAIQHGQALKPGSPDLNDMLSEAFLVSGHVEQARQLCEAPAAPMTEDARHLCLAVAYHTLGRQADAEDELGQFKKLEGDSRPFEYAEVYAQWGNAPDALQWLTQAEQVRDPGLIGLKVYPLFDPIRNEPQFKALLARMKFPP
jgi:TolB-like protein